MAYIQASGGAKGLPVEEIFQGANRDVNIVNKNGAFHFDTLGDYTAYCDASICIGSISGSYFKKVTAKKAGYYSYMTSYPGGSGSFAPIKSTPVYVSNGGTIYDQTSYNVSACFIVYYGETNPFA